MSPSITSGRTHSVFHVTVPPGLRACIVVAAAVLSLMVVLVPTGASAAWLTYRTGSLCAGCKDAGPTRTELTSTFGQAESSSRMVQAGAHWAGNWELHGSWAAGWAEACQTYPRYHLGAMVRNPHTVSQSSLWGTDGYVANGQGTYWC